MSGTKKQTRKEIKSDLRHLYEMVAQADTGHVIQDLNSRGYLLIEDARWIGKKYGFFNYWK
jgi:hypothetical protein